MPQIFNKSVMTEDGARLLIKAISGKSRILITGMALGCGTYTESEKDVTSLCRSVALKRETQRVPISSLSVKTETSVTVTAVFSNDGLEEPYNINEIGLFARDEGEEGDEVLYSIAVVSEDEGEVMPVCCGDSPIQIIHSWTVTVSNSAEVSINLLDDGAFALLSDVGLISQLVTEDKSSIVAAVNCISGRIDDISSGKSMLGLSEAGSIGKDNCYFIADSKTGARRVRHSTVANEAVGQAEIKDLSGVLGKVGENVNFRQLVDAIADKVMTKLLLKSQVINSLLATIPGNPLDAVQGAVLAARDDAQQDLIDQINSNIYISGKFETWLLCHRVIGFGVILVIPRTNDRQKLSITFIEVFGDDKIWHECSIKDIKYKTPHVKTQFLVMIDIGENKYLTDGQTYLCNVHGEIVCT